MCVKIEKCCYFLGIFNAVVYALLTSASLVLFMYCLYLMSFIPLEDLYSVGGCAVVLLNYGVISFAFSVILVIGIRKRNQKYLEVYLAYIYVVTIVCVIASVTYWTVFKGREILFNAIAVTICCLNLTMSIVALKTHMKFVALRPLSNNLLLTQNQFLFIESKCQYNKT